MEQPGEGQELLQSQLGRRAHRAQSCSSHVRDSCRSCLEHSLQMRRRWQCGRASCGGQVNEGGSAIHWLTSMLRAGTPASMSFVLIWYMTVIVDQGFPPTILSVNHDQLRGRIVCAFRHTRVVFAPFLATTCWGVWVCSAHKVKSRSESRCKWAKAEASPWAYVRGDSRSHVIIRHRYRSQLSRACPGF